MQLQTIVNTVNPEAVAPFCGENYQRSFFKAVRAVFYRLRSPLPGVRAAEEVSELLAFAWYCGGKADQFEDASRSLTARDHEKIAVLAKRILRESTEYVWELLAEKNRYTFEGLIAEWAIAGGLVAS